MFCLPNDNLSGPDPTDCHNPVCGSKSSMFFSSMKGEGKGGKTEGAKTSTSKADSAQDDNSMTKTEFTSSGCPVDREELGRQSWTLLHTMAAYYPDSPSDNDKQHMTNFLQGLSHFYPCSHCAAGFRETLTKRPPAVESREALSIWMCEAHNDVSRELGMATVKCDIESLDKRWRTGRKECWPDDQNNNSNNL